MANKVSIIVDVDVKGSGEISALKKDLAGLGDAGKSAAPGVASVGKSGELTAATLARLGGDAKGSALHLAALQSQSSAVSSKMNELGKAVASGAKSFDQAEKELKDFKDSLAPIPSATEKSTSAFSALKGAIGGLAAGAALATVGKQMLEFGKASVAAASDVQETQSKFNAVFKDLAGDTTKELQTFADAANRSVYDLQGFAATLQDTFVPLGFARDEAASTSIQLVKLAEDLASFNNLDTGDVVRDLQSAMVGNTETLRKYGIVASQAAIDQEALSLGLDFTKGSMDAQTKAAAILSITMKSTADAQGDAIATANSYANVSKGLEAAMLDLKVAIGDQLLPAMTDSKIAITEGVSAFANYKQAQVAITQAVRDGVITQGEANDLQNKLMLTSYSAADAQAELASKVEAVAAANEAQLAPMQSLISAAESYDRVLTKTTGSITAETQASLDAIDARKATADSLAYAAKVADDYVEAGVQMEFGADEIAAAEERRAAATDAAAEADDRAIAGRKAVADAVQNQISVFREAATLSDALIEAQAGGNAEEIIAAQSAIQESYKQTAFDALLAGSQTTAQFEQALEAGLAMGAITPEQAALQDAIGGTTLRVGELNSLLQGGSVSVGEYSAAFQSLGASASTSLEQAVTLAQEASGLVDTLASEGSAGLSDFYQSLSSGDATAEPADIIPEVDLEPATAALEELSGQLEAFSEAPHVVLLDADAVAAMATAEQLKFLVEETAGDYKINFDVTTSGSVPNTPAHAPGRATGGPVGAGQVYTVGERGPELFVPSTSGTIIPNNQTTNNNNSNSMSFNIAAGGSQEQARDIMRELRSSGLRGLG